MNSVGLTFELNRIAQELYKSEASQINPKSGTSASFLQYFVIAGADAIKRLKEKREPEIKANSERLAKKYADEANAPIIAELTKQINDIKENVRNYVNTRIDKRLEQIKYSRLIPIREKSWKLLQFIESLVKMDVDIPESDWKLWGEQFSGHHQEERYFEALAKQKGITILPVFDPYKSIERLEAFRDMANSAINNLDNAESSIVAMSFLKSSANSPLAKLIDEIDSDLASIIPAEKLTVMQRLKDAERNAYDKDNVALSAKIKVFMERNAERLSTPEELNESLYAEAEQYIQKGMSAKKGDE